MVTEPVPVTVEHAVFCVCEVVSMLGPSNAIHAALLAPVNSLTCSRLMNIESLESTVHRLFPSSPSVHELPVFEDPELKKALLALPLL